MKTKRTKTERLLNPQCAKDYGLSVPLNEFLSDPAGLKAWEEYLLDPLTPKEWKEIYDSFFKQDTSSQVEADPLTS